MPVGSNHHILTVNRPFWLGITSLIAEEGNHSGALLLVPYIYIYSFPHRVLTNQKIYGRYNFALFLDFL